MSNDTKKIKRERSTTPIGIAVWPKVNTPESFKDGPLLFKLKLRVLLSEAAHLIAVLDSVGDDAFQEATEKLVGKRDKKGAPRVATRNDNYTVEVDDTGNKTGYIILNFKSTHRPFLCDAAGTKSVAEVWGGSRVKVNFTPAAYFVEATGFSGCTCYLNAVQIIELVTKGSAGGSASQYGFGKEDGYTEEAVVAVADTPTQATTEGASREAASQGEF